MENKISYALKKCKSVLIVVLILWVLLSIVLIAPASVALIDSETSEVSFFEILFDNMSNFGETIGRAFTKSYIKTFLKGDLYLLISLFFFGIVGVIKTLPKHDYKDIEHGSSDWANGEEYSVLSKNKGIILAEKHYLPVDKRGNVNVLVVGRFRFW